MGRFQVVEKDELEGLVLADREAGSQVTLAPARGGMVTRFRARGREVLYLDEATLHDRTKNVRGGIPVLFPIAGRLEGERYGFGGREYALKQHGFGRNLSWNLLEADTFGQARATLVLDASDATLAVFPWRFRIAIAYSLLGDTLAVASTVTNFDTKPMPLHLGFHPYFAIPQADKAATKLDAGISAEDGRVHVFDNRAGQPVPFEGFDLTKDELDLHLPLPVRPELVEGARDRRATRVEAPNLRFDLLADEPFAWLVVWTLAGKDFVCVEPWTAPGGALKTGQGLLQLPPGGNFRARFEIAVQP